MFPGIQALPVEFDRLDIGSPMPPHAVPQHARHPSQDKLDHRGHEFDTTLLRKEKDLYEGYSYERVTPQQPNKKATWSVVSKERMPLSQGELLAMVTKQKRKGPAPWALLKSNEMKGFKRQQVSQLIDGRMRADPRFEYELAGLKLDQHKDKPGRRSTSTFQVILKRQLRKDLTSAGLTDLGKLHEPNREIVDLNRLSDEPSEGSSQDYHHGSPPPPLHFGPPPHEPFLDHHRFQPPHQMPFMHHPAPPMPDIHHQMPHSGAPSPHAPHMENPFIHQDHLQAHLPPPFIPPMPSHTAHHGGHEQEPKEVKEAKHKKEAKHVKPMIHQEKPPKSHKHRKAASESDWDIISESSESSRAYTDWTPDTSYSGNSARKDRDHHRGKDSRRSSHSHRDDYGKERHEEAYRVHRRKPTVSTDRPRRNSGRSRYDFEDIEVIPASNSRTHRPYLTRSRTSAHRSKRVPEYLERPAFHSRHMSYDDDRYHDYRGLTPPGRRASIYAPKRPLALDNFSGRVDHHDRLERDEIRRELLREERRKEEMREAVARELEIEKEEMRRRDEEMRRRDRAMSRDMLYDERPGRYSRGYDNDRFAW